MYIVTNRQIHENKTGFKQFGDIPNVNGPHELRLAEATKVGSKWQIRVLPDDPKDLTPEDMKRLREPKKTKWTSAYVATTVFDRLQKQKKNLLLFVHGFNNNVESVVQRADRLERQYGVEVIAFSWPANGGGAGVADYRSDKRDAIASTGALDRALQMFRVYLDQLRGEQVKRITNLAEKRFSRQAEVRDEFIAKKIAQECPFTVNLMLHSMGNYLFKKLLQSSINHARDLLFDNVIMVAADANSEGHRDWVDEIHCRRRVYITINEDDVALRAARVKGGEEQLARLGHYPYNLDSRQSVYVDFTEASWVRSAHAYFEGTPLRNSQVKKFFHRCFNGERAEVDLPFDSARHLYQIR